MFVHADWQVERVWLDRGDGLREWFEVRHGDTVVHQSDRTAVQLLLAVHGLDLSRFTPVDTIDDGCE